MDPEKYLILAYLEEDNVQRSYFRVKPMLTVQGIVKEESETRWPNDGFLRIVPDRNEQHTFKDRMRSLGGWCMLDITGYASESNKIRSNKNYNPEQGEVNQFIIYSDAVKSLPDYAFYELFNASPEDYASLSTAAITPKFYIRQDDTLYGPVSKTEPQKPETAAATEAVIFDISIADQEHAILCIPAENRITERSQRFRGNRAQEVTPIVVVAPVSTTDKTEGSNDAAKETTEAVENDTASKEAVTSEKSEERTLPIGKPLTILDQTQTFEETLQQISQPLSSGANLLREEKLIQPPVNQAPTATLTGTPLVRAPLRTATPQSKNKLQEYVAAQCRVMRDEPPAAPLPADATMKKVSNPVEDACYALTKVWQTPETHKQVIDCILSLEGMKATLDASLQGSQRFTPLSAAYRRYLQDLEAERLSALVQLDKAKANLDEFRHNTVEEMSAKAKEKLEKLAADERTLSASVEDLKQQLNLLTATRDELQRQTDSLQRGVLPEGIARMIAESGLAAPVTAMPLRLNPVSGNSFSAEEMLHRTQLTCEACNIPYEKNRAVALLVLLATSSRIGLVTSSVPAASTLAANLANAMGWQSAFAHQTMMEQKVVISGRPADSTPVILMTSLSMYHINPNCRKLLLAKNNAQLTRNAAYEADPWPIFPISNLPFIPSDAIAQASPVSAASVLALLNNPAVDEQTVALALKPIMDKTTMLSGVAWKNMVRFTAACAGLMDGGLVAACDWAILLWLLPALEKKNPDELKELLSEYPLAIASLSYNA